MNMKIPDKYRSEIAVNYDDRLYFSGWIRTADNLFTDKKQELPALIFDAFNFEYDGVKYEFKVKVESPNDSKHYPHVAFINDNDLSKCWFNGSERVVHLVEEDDDEND